MERQEVVDIFHAKHISGGSQAIKVNVYSPSTNNHTPRLVRNNECRPYQQQSWGSLFNYLQFEFGTGNPYYRPSRARKSESTLVMRITRLAWKILTTSCRSMTIQAHKKDIYLKFLEVAHANLLRTAG